MANYPQLDDQVGVWKLKEVNNAVSGGYWRNGGSRGIFAGGQSPTILNQIDFITISSTGNAADFGDLSVVRGSGNSDCVSSFTRGLFTGGVTPSRSLTTDNVTIQTTGNAANFGNLSGSARQSLGGVSNSTRGIAAGGMILQPIMKLVM